MPRGDSSRVSTNYRKEQREGGGGGGGLTCGNGSIHARPLPGVDLFPGESGPFPKPRRTHSCCNALQTNIRLEGRGEEPHMST